MKAKRSRFAVFIAFALLALAIFGTATAFAAEYSGATKASDITAKEAVVLEGDTVLTMDDDLTIKSITGKEYSLTIKGDNELTVTDSINVKALTVNDADVHAGSIHVVDDATITKATVKVDAKEGIVSEKGKVTVVDKAKDDDESDDDDDEADGKSSVTTQESVTVTFDANGHGTAPDAVEVEAGGKITKPEPDPEAEGFDFGGWYTESACENEYKFDSEVNENITLYAKWSEHKLVKVEKKDATCTEDGNIEYWHCDGCDKYYEDEAGEKEATADKVIVKSTGHKLTKTDAKAATCEKAGNIAYWHCSVCDKYFSDAKATTEITKSGTITKALGHNLTKTDAKAATCDTAGNTAYWHCSRCDKYFSDADGTKEIKKSDTVTNATGVHTWGAWTVTKQATTTAEGEQQRKCSVCGKVETQSIPKLPTYTFSNGATALSWTKNSTVALSFTVNRSVDDTTTFTHFTSLSVDGRQLTQNTNYTVTSGSLKGTLLTSYLNTLTVGNHTLTATFNDGSATTNLTIRAASTNTNTTSNTSNANAAKGNSSTTPTTGDTISAIIPAAIAGIALIVVIIALVARKRTSKN